MSRMREDVSQLMDSTLILPENPQKRQKYRSFWIASYSTARMPLCIAIPRVMLKRLQKTSTEPLRTQHFIKFSLIIFCEISILNGLLSRRCKKAWVFITEWCQNILDRKS